MTQLASTATSLYTIMLILFQRKSYTLDEEAHTCTEEDMPPDESIPKFTAPAGAVFRHYDQIGSFIPNLGVSTEYLRMDTGIIMQTNINFAFSQ